jgi:hypothetical protein
MCVLLGVVYKMSGLEHGVNKIVEQDISRNIKKADAWVMARK